MCWQLVGISQHKSCAYSSAQSKGPLHFYNLHAVYLVNGSRVATAGLMMAEAKVWLKAVGTSGLVGIIAGSAVASLDTPSEWVSGSIPASS